VAAVAFELPWPPSLNHYYRHVGPRVLISKAGRLYREAAVARLRGLLPKPLDGPVRLLAEFYPPDFRRRDLDNLLKCVQDALTFARVYHDDSQIAELHAFKREPLPPDGLAHFELSIA